MIPNEDEAAAVTAGRLHKANPVALTDSVNQKKNTL